MSEMPREIWAEPVKHKLDSVQNMYGSWIDKNVAGCTHYILKSEHDALQAKLDVARKALETVMFDFCKHNKVNTKTIAEALAQMREE